MIARVTARADVEVRGRAQEVGGFRADPPRDPAGGECSQHRDGQGAGPRPRAGRLGEN